MGTGTAGSRTKSATTYATLAVTAYLIGVPLLLLVLASLRGPADYLPFEAGARWTLDNFRYFYLDRTLYTRVLPDTMLFAAGSTVLAYGIGFAFAWLFERNSIRFGNALVVVIALPMILPTPALAQAWIQMLGPNAGWVNLGLRAVFGLPGTSGPFDVFSRGGLIWCQGLTAVPIAFFLLRPAIRAINRSGEEAGYISGATPLKVHLQLTVPRILPSLAAPFILLLLLMMEQVDFPYIIGTAAQINVLGTRLLWEMNNPSGLPNLGAAAAGAFVVLGMSFLLLLILRRCLRTPSRFHSVNADRHNARWHPGWLSRTALYIAWLYVVVAVVLPVLVLIATSLHISATIVPEMSWKWSGESFAALAGQDRLLHAAFNTTVLAVVAGIATTLLGTLVAIVSCDRSNLVERVLDDFSITSIGMPSMVVALGVAMTYLTFRIGLYGSVWILVVACSYRIALSTRVAAAGLAQLHPAMTEAASMSGAGWGRSRATIHLPLLAPGIMSTAALMIVMCAREFTIPLMLYSPDNVVLPVLMMQLYQAGLGAEAAATALILAAVCALILILIHLASRLLVRLRGM